jgi:hypothetical protein
MLLAPSTSAATPGAPPFLSRDHSAPDVSSTTGSGNFGSWGVDQFGLPRYTYAIDQQTSPIAPQTELSGNVDAWSQVGNDHIVANAYNHGYTQLWSQDRTYQWMNLYDAANKHFSGGFGYVNAGGATFSTLYDDRPTGAASQRDFGMGYFHKSVATGGLSADDVVYSPFGDDPVLLHDVTLTNTSGTPRTGSYFEYWDVNPQIQAPARFPRAVAAPTYSALTQTLSAAQLPNGQDNSPLTIFSAALNAGVSHYDTDTSAFFGAGTRAAPAAVTAGNATNSIALPGINGVVGNTMMALQSPINLAPGQSVTLRYIYGFAHPAGVDPLVAKYRAAANPYQASEQAWSSWLPRASFGPQYSWLSRELEWDAYTVRSGATYDEGCGHHIISQGGYYQYYFGENEAFRDPLQHMLPMIYADPKLAREVIRYSAHEQPALLGQIPYGVIGLCNRFDLGTSNDLDQWLMWSTAEYVLATRDTAFLDEVIPYQLGTSSDTIWNHVKAAYQHQETIGGHGLHGEYLTLPTGTTGDWSDFATEFLQLTESNLVTAQAVYIYQRLALVADLRNDTAFAGQLRATSAGDLAVVKGELGAMGWFARGYAGTQQVGYGTPFLEPQAWALLGGATTPDQSTRLIAQFRRFLTGIGAPAALNGPAKIGSALTGAAADPGITEHPTVTTGTISNNVGWPPGAWYAVNGWMVWAMGELDGVVPNARAYAWDEFLRNTLTAHAIAYPNHWDGVISIDDECASFYAPNPAICGIGLTTAYNTQIMHQPAYSLFDILHLAGITPMGHGYRVVPHLPMDTFNLRFPLVGVAQEQDLIRGYLKPEAGGVLTMDVAPPPGVSADSAVAWVNGDVVPHTVAAGLVEFSMPTSAGIVTDWAITGPGAVTASSGGLPNTATPAWPLALCCAGFVLLAIMTMRLRRRSRVPIPARMEAKGG